MMTNSEALLELKESGMYGNQVHQETIELAISALEENAKLKTEIDRLKGELKSEREFRANVRIELFDRKTEIEQLIDQIQYWSSEVCDREVEE